MYKRQFHWQTMAFYNDHQLKAFHMESIDCLMIEKMNVVVSLFVYTMCTHEYIMWMHPDMNSTEQYMLSMCLYMMSTNHYTICIYEYMMW
jgi:hypothetical protein